jgi:hypothetical protein
MKLLQSVWRDVTSGILPLRVPVTARAQLLALQPVARGSSTGAGFGALRATARLTPFIPGYGLAPSVRQGALWAAAVAARRAIRPRNFMMLVWICFSSINKKNEFDERAVEESSWLGFPLTLNPTVKLVNKGRMKSGSILSIYLWGASMSIKQTSRICERPFTSRHFYWLIQVAAMLPLSW